MKKIMLAVLVLVMVLSSCEFIETPRTTSYHGVDSGNNFYRSITNTGRHINTIDTSITIICNNNVYNFSNTIYDFNNGETNIFAYNLGSDIYIYSSIIDTIHVY